MCQLYRRHCQWDLLAAIVLFLAYSFNDSLFACSWGYQQLATSTPVQPISHWSEWWQASGLGVSYSLAVWMTVMMSYSSTSLTSAMRTCLSSLARTARPRKETSKLDRIHLLAALRVSSVVNVLCVYRSPFQRNTSSRGTYRVSKPRFSAARGSQDSGSGEPKLPHILQTDDAKWMIKRSQENISFARGKTMDKGVRPSWNFL